MVMTGASIGYGHGPVDGWDYVIVTDRDGTRDLARGWLAPMPFDASTCEMVAG